MLGQNISLPHISWYAKGGIFRPGAPQVIGVGDARVEEAVTPIDKLRGYVMDAVRDASGSDDVAEEIRGLRQAVYGMRVAIDGKKLVGAIVDEMDYQLGGMVTA